MRSQARALRKRSWALALLALRANARLVLRVQALGGLEERGYQYGEVWVGVWARYAAKSHSMLFVRGDQTVGKL